MELEAEEPLALFLETAAMAEITILADILQTLLEAVLSEEEMEARGRTEATQPTTNNIQVVLELAVEQTVRLDNRIIPQHKVGRA